VKINKVDTRKKTNETQEFAVGFGLTNNIEHSAPKPYSQNEIFRLEGIVKHFGGVTALGGVDFSLCSGVIHGLVGENGAGKSTLIKTICGIERPDQGTMFLDGRSYAPMRPIDAKKSGIQVVHQELNLLHLMSVADNVCFEYLPRKWGILHKKELEYQARVALSRVGLEHINLSERVENFGIAYQQLIEIARALKSQSRILILDEPTATLTAMESANLFRLLHELVEKNVAILLVSHHLDEIMEHCNEITVMRNGHTVANYLTKNTNINQLINDMVERRIELGDEKGKKIQDFPKSDQTNILELKNLRSPASPHKEGISFTVKKGEILGLAGLIGAGRTEILRAIAGVDKAVGGHIMLKGKKRLYRRPAHSIRDGIAFVTEDRRHEGLILAMSIACNISLASTADINYGGVLSKVKEQKIALRQSQALELKYGDLQDSVSTLSGGNQQKVVLAKWLARSPDILLLDEPTRGVDVGAKAEIYALIRQLAAQGKAILLVSSDMRELMLLSDRILVMAQHQLIGELSKNNFSQQRILQLAYQQAV